LWRYKLNEVYNKATQKARKVAETKIREEVEAHRKEKKRI